MVAAMVPAEVPIVLSTILLLLMASAAGAEEEEEEIRPPSFGRRNNTCTVAGRDCDDCMRLPECAWCKDLTWQGPRCDLAKW